MNERRSHRPLRAALATALGALALAGCVSLGPDVPASLMTLTPASAPPADLARSGTVGTALTVLVPAVPQKLRTPRIPVQTDATSLAYLADSQWVEAPARLFRRLLSETLSARTGRLVLDDSQYITAPGEQLAGELLEFGVDASRREVIVVYQAMRLTGDGQGIAQRRFEAREPIGAITPAAVGPALNSAANRVAADVAAWVGG